MKIRLVISKDVPQDEVWLVCHAPLDNVRIQSVEDFVDRFYNKVPLPVPAKPISLSELRDSLPKPLEIIQPSA